MARAWDAWLDEPPHAVRPQVASVTISDASAAGRRGKRLLAMSNFVPGVFEVRVRGWLPRLVSMPAEAVGIEPRQSRCDYGSGTARSRVALSCDHHRDRCRLGRAAWNHQQRCEISPAGPVLRGVVVAAVT